MSVLLRVLAMVFVLSLAIAARCQALPSAEPTQTLQVGTHLTIEDVVVTDSSGKAVPDLPVSAFHVTDDGAAQSIRNFEESSRANVASKITLPHGVFSNEGITEPDASVDVLLIDPIGIEIADQMFLRLQVLAYLQSMPAGTTIAVYRTRRDGRPLLVQSMTQDRALLIKAINNSIPTLAVSVPQEEVFYNAIAELSNIADTLVQAQGRKSLIWFTGKFPLSQTLGGNGAEGVHEFDATREALKSVYRKLEIARIAVFPIDVRGVMDASLAVNLQAATKPNQAQGPNMIAGGEAEVQGSWSGMDEVASATGGRAFHGRNRLTGDIRSAVDLGRHFYTLSYSAQPYAENGQWHKVHIVVDGGYIASYREGYFARSSAADQQMLNATLRGNEALYGRERETATSPIVFQAKVRPISGKPVPSLVIQYAISSKDIQFSATETGIQQARLKVAALAYDASGSVLSDAVDDVTTHYSAAQMDQAKRVGVPVLQEITVRSRAKFLLLSVVDLETGRTGTIQMTLDSAMQAPK